MKIRFAALTALAALSVGTACGAQLLPKDTEVWTPVPPVVAPGAQVGGAPSDALVLFDGTDLSQWVAVKDKAPAGWTVEGGVLTVRAAFSGAHVRLEVEDTGVGIPPELRDKVFSPFFSTKGKGSGLGLAMIRKTLDDLGGSAELASIPGEGTRVTLLLPPQLAVAKQGPSG